MIGAVRPVIIAGNWKMNTTPATAPVLAVEIAAATAVQGVIRVICPPVVALAPVADALAGTGVAVGAQDVHSEVAGAYTGSVAASMIVPAASWAIVGHSERRRDQCETDTLIGRKLLRCGEEALRPILCVGEQLDERESGRAEVTVRDQVRGALGVALEGSGVPADLVVAYEPVWAIGTGRAASGADASAMADVIRATVAEVIPGDAESFASDLPILYGGSVTSRSIGEFLAEPAIDGALVGGASLKVDEMAGIVARAGLTAARRLEAGATR
jgi:triosephosphate isomerase